MFKIEKKSLCVHQVVISSIMCGYNEEDWTELAKMAEVIKTISHYNHKHFYRICSLMMI